jgi:hypothetical protein
MQNRPAYTLGHLQLLILCHNYLCRWGILIDHHAGIILTGMNYETTSLKVFCLHFEAE